LSATGIPELTLRPDFASSRRTASECEGLIGLLLYMRPTPRGVEITVVVVQNRRIRKRELAGVRVRAADLHAWP
jgi:hypothetical protein